MQKSLVIVLAVCLISVHAFVKREAPAAADNNYIEKVQKETENLLKMVKESFNSFNAEELKKGMEDFNKAVGDFKTNTLGLKQQ